MVSGVKWVDEVIPDAPYAINESFMKKLFTEYNIDYIIHGDDPCLLPDGSDAYELAKKAGRYKQIKRTEGVSSTDIVGKLFFFSSWKYCKNSNLISVIGGTISLILTTQCKVFLVLYILKRQLFLYGVWLPYRLGCNHNFGCHAVLNDHFRKCSSITGQAFCNKMDYIARDWSSLLQTYTHHWLGELIIICRPT